MLVSMIRYTLPISVNTAMMTVRMPRSSGIQPPGPEFTPASVAMIPMTWFICGIALARRFTYRLRTNSTMAVICSSVSMAPKPGMRPLP